MDLRSELEEALDVTGEFPDDDDDSLSVELFSTSGTCPPVVSLVVAIFPKGGNTRIREEEVETEIRRQRMWRGCERKVDP